MDDEQALTRRTSSFDHAFVATHALPFLDLDAEVVDYYRVSRAAGGTVVDPISSDVLGILTENAIEAGVSPVEILQLTRAFLIVEGKHDELIIRAFFEGELRSHRVELLPLRGIRNHLALVELEYLHRHGAPLFAMFDKVRSQYVQAERLPDLGGSEEERAVVAVRAMRNDIRFLPFHEPDIICAIPDDVTRAALKRKWGREAADRFSGWASIKQQAHGAERVKRRLFEETRIPMADDRVESMTAVFLKNVVEVLRDHPLRPAGSLQRAMNQLFAEVAEPERV